MAATGPARSSPTDPGVAHAGAHRGAILAVLLTFPALLAVTAGLEWAGLGARWVMALPPVVVVAVLVAMAGRGLVAAPVDARAWPAWASGASLAVEHLSPAVLLAGTAAIYAAGVDGLPIALGGVGGLALAAILAAGPMQRLGGAGVPEALAARFAAGRGGSSGARIAVVLAKGVMLTAGVVLLAGILGGGSALVGLLLGLAPVAALVACTTGVVVAAVVVVGARGWTGAAIAAALLVGIGLPLVIMATGRHGVPLPQAALGRVLEDIARVEFRLIRAGLIDFEVFRAHATPFLSMSLTNVLAVTAVLAFGAMCLPAISHAAAVARDASSARRTLLWAALIAVVTVTLLPVAAAYVKLGVEEAVVRRVGPDGMPGWMFEAGRLGLIDICKAPALDAASATEACRKLPRHPGRLALHDVAIARHAELMVLPIAAAMPAFVAGGLIAALLAAGFVAPAMGLVGMSRLLSRVPAATDRAHSRLVLGGCVVLAVMAGWLARGSGVGFVDGMCWSASLAAGGLAAPLVLALWWRRTTAWGVFAGIVVGVAITLFYIAGTRFLAPWFHDTWGHLQSNAPGALRAYAALQTALAGTEGAMRESLLAARDARAQSLAGWWGVRNLAAGIFGLPMAAIATVVVSLITGGRRRAVAVS